MARNTDLKSSQPIEEVPAIADENNIMADVAEVTATQAQLLESLSTPRGIAVSKSLWRNCSFNIFWFGQSLSVLGDSFAMIALPLLVLQATGSVAEMGVVTAIFGIGQVVSGLIAGVIVDRVNRRRLMIICDLMRTVLYATIPLGWWLLGPQMWLLFLVAALGSCFGQFFQISSITSLANMVGREQIVEANAKLQVTYGISFVAGPALAGLVAAQFGPPVAIAFDAVSFAVSAGSLSFNKWQQPAKPVTNAKPQVLREWTEGFKFLWNQPVLRAITFLVGAYSFLTLGCLDLFIYHVKHDLGQSDSAAGLVLGFASIGGILSGVFISWLRKNIGFGPCVLGGMAVASLMLALIGQAPTVLIIVPLAVLFIFADNIKGISSMTLRQQITPDYLLGRVTSVFWTFTTVPGPLGAFIVTRIAENANVAVTLLIVGSLGFVLAVIGLFTPVRQRFPERKYQVD